MADLLVIVPTRGRPDNIRRLLAAWDGTEAWDAAALVFAGDADDPQIGGYRQLAQDRRGDGRHWWLTERPEWTSMVEKLNRVAREESGDWTALGFGGDDHLPRTPGWARVYLDALAQLGSGIVYGDDQLVGERIPTQWAMTADIVQTLGRMVPAPVEHLNCDSSIYDLGHAAGCIRYLPEVVIEHMHPAAGKAINDDSYRRVNSAEQVRRDGERYQRWRADQLQQDAVMVRRLREAVATGG